MQFSWFLKLIQSLVFFPQDEIIMTGGLSLCVFQTFYVRVFKSPKTMVALSLKICVRHCNVVKTMQFEPSTAVYDACRVIRERVPEAQTGQGKPLVSHWLLHMCLYVLHLEAKEMETLSGTRAH